MRGEAEDGVGRVDGGQHVDSVDTPVSTMLSLPSTCESNAKDLSFVQNTPEAARSGEFCGSNAVFFYNYTTFFID